MTMIGSEIAYPGMKLLNFDLGLCPVLPALPFAGKGPLRSPKYGKRAFQVVGIREVLAVARGQKMFYPDGEPDGREGALLTFLIEDVKADLKIPFIGFTADRKGLDLGSIRQWPVKADLHSPDVLYPEPIAGKFDTVAVGREYNADEPAGRFESWIAWILSGLDSPEKGGKSLIEPSHGCLGRTEVETGKERIDRSL